MDPSDFHLLVTPLVVIIFVLVILVIFYAEGEEATSKKLKALETQKAKQEKATAEEIAKLDQMREDNVIDDCTYNRLRRLLTHAEMNDAGDGCTRPPSRDPS
jgi:Tfp pilus assembly protein PilO